jgi:hypothetical protein
MAGLVAERLVGEDVIAGLRAIAGQGANALKKPADLKRFTCCTSAASPTTGRSG